MKNQVSILAIWIIGIIVFVLSLTGFFLLGIEKNALNVSALAFLLLSEIVLFVGLTVLRFFDVKHSNVFLKAGLTTTVSLYFLTTLISLFFTGAFREKLSVFIFIEIAIIALFAIITISIIAFSRMIERRNEEDVAKIGNNIPKRGGF